MDIKRIILISTILILTIINGGLFYSHNYKITPRDVYKGGDKIGRTMAHHLVLSHKIKESEFNKNISEKVTKNCITETCMVEKTKEYIQDNITYQKTDKFLKPKKVIEKKAGDCKSKAIVGATILVNQGIEVQYTYQKNHICLYAPRYGFINCFKERPIKYMSPTIKLYK